MRHLKSRGLSGVQMFISDACLGLVESLGDFYPEALWQRCVVHFYRNVFSYVPRGKMEEVSLMLKAIHASENKEAARAKAKEVIKKLKEMRLGSAARWVERCVEETLTYYEKQFRRHTGGGSGLTIRWRGFSVLRQTSLDFCVNYFRRGNRPD